MIYHAEGFPEVKKEGMESHAAFGRVVSCIKPFLRNTGAGGYSGLILCNGMLIISDFQVLPM